MMAARRCTPPIKASPPPPTMPILSFFTSPPFERGVKGGGRRLEVDPPHEGRRLPGPVHPVHAGVLPLHGERAVVADAVQRPDDLLEVHPAPAHRAEVPAAAVVAEGEVRRQDAALAVEGPLGVLHVGVVDPVRKPVYEPRGVHELPVQVARVEVEAEGLAPAYRLQSTFRRVDVVGDLGRVHLEGEPDALLVEDVEDRVPPLGEVPEALVDLFLTRRREEVELVPDGGAGEARDRLDPEPRCGPRRVLHLLGGATADALRVPVAPDLFGEDGFVTLVYGVVADGLADEVVADRITLKIVLAKEVQAALGVVVVGERLLHLEVVAPTGELQAVVAHLLGERGQLFEGHVRPLAGEQGNWSCHWSSFLNLLRVSERFELLSPVSRQRLYARTRGARMPFQALTRLGLAVRAAVQRRVGPVQVAATSLLRQGL